MIKNTITFFFWFLLVGFANGQNTKNQYNLGFEYPLISAENSWIPLLDGFKWKLDTVDKVHGKSSFNFTRTYLSTEFEMCLFQKILLPQPGKVVKISLFSKSDQLESAWLIIVGFNKNMVKVISDSINIQSNMQWQNNTATITSDDQIHMVSLDIRARETFKSKKRIVSFWLDNMCISIEGKEISTLEKKPINYSGNEINEINTNCQLNARFEIPLDELSRIGNKRIIGFGESVHGSKEIHQAIFNNIMQLISNKKCRLVLLEIPIETGLILNQFVNDDVIAEIQLDTIVSGFMVDTNTFINFLKRVKDFNKNSGNNVFLFGIDDYVNKSTPRIINKFIKNKNLDSQVTDSFLTIINKTYLRSKHLKFAEQNATSLTSLLGEKDYLMLLQILRIRTDTLCRLSPTWHEWGKVYRDYLMWQNTKFAIEHLSDSNSTVALWGHLSHLNKNTPSIFNNISSLGQYITKQFANEYFLIGCLVGSGEISTWELNWKKRITQKLGTTPSQSLELLCNQSKEDYFLKSILKISDNSVLLRNIGAVFHENSQFSPMEVKETMDGFIFIRNSTPAEISIVKD